MVDINRIAIRKRGRWRSNDDLVGVCNVPSTVLNKYRRLFPGLLSASLWERANHVHFVNEGSGHREEKQLVQGHVAGKWKGKD